MHTYLRAVGFSNITSKKELQKILEEAVRSYDEKIIVDEGKKVFAEMAKSFGCDIGIKVCGEYDENDEFQMEYYFPYFQGTGITTTEDVLIEERAEKECFSGACDDIRVGVTLIFYLANAGAYLREKYKDVMTNAYTTITFSGLSIDGKILLPVYKNKNENKKEQEQQKIIRAHTIMEAKKGNQEALDSLTMAEMHTYDLLAKRVRTEDILSIVESHFMPYGMECDRYNVLGEIVDVDMCVNELTGEEIYQLTILCNDMQFDVCINKLDLLGEPEVGRRFKGIIWLQGNLNF